MSLKDPRFHGDAVKPLGPIALVLALILGGILLLVDWAALDRREP